MAEAKGGGPAKAELPAESVEQRSVGACHRSWSAAGRLCGIPVQPWRQTTPWAKKRGDQWRQVGSRPGGGVPFLMRCRRILSTCAGSVRWPDLGPMMTAMTFIGL